MEVGISCAERGRYDTRVSGRIRRERHREVKLRCTQTWDGRLKLGVIGLESGREEEKGGRGLPATNRLGHLDGKSGPETRGRRRVFLLMRQTIAAKERSRCYRTMAKCDRRWFPELEPLYRHFKTGCDQEERRVVVGSSRQ